MIGYALLGQDNESHMFDPDDNTLPVCEGCGYVKDLDYVPRSFKLTLTKYDVSYTFDGRCVVSRRFKEFCARSLWDGLEFRGLPNDRHFYSFLVHNIVRVDAKRMKLECLNRCPVCRRCESVTPGIPLFLKDSGHPLTDGFFATDVHFGSGNGRTPVIVMGIETRVRMKKERFKGAVFIEVDGEAYGAL